MKIKLADGVTLTIPVANIIKDLREQGYEVTDIDPKRGEEGRGSMGKKLYDKTYFDGATVSVFEALSSIIPALIGKMSASVDPKTISLALKHRFKAGLLTEYVNSEYPNSVIAETLGKPVLSGRLLSEMAKTPVLEKGVSQGVIFYVWKPLDPAWVSKGGTETPEINPSEEWRAQRAYYKVEKYTPKKLRK